MEAAPLVYRMLTQQNGHFYVCGDCAMAEDVANTLRLVLQKAGGMDQEQSEAFLLLLRVFSLFFSLRCVAIGFNMMMMTHSLLVCKRRRRDAIRRIFLELLTALRILSITEGNNKP